MGLQISLGQNDNEKNRNIKKNIFDMGLQQQLIFLVVPLPLAFILLHLGLVKYVCYHLLEGMY